MCHERRSSGVSVASGLVVVAIAWPVLAPVASAIAALASLATAVLAVLVVATPVVVGLVAVSVLRQIRAAEVSRSVEVTAHREIGPGVAGLLPAGDSRGSGVVAEVVEVLR
jgi:hypothetical protein